MAVAVALPLQAPLHVTCVDAEIAATIAAGSVIVVSAVAVQPIASVTVTVYEPGASPVQAAPVQPPVQLYV